MDTVGVAPLQYDSIHDAACVLARAFASDPGLLFVLSDAEQRTQLAPTLARLGLQYALRFGAPLVTSGDVRGVAIWFPPEAREPTAAGLAETGVTDAPGLLGNEAWARLKSMLDLLDALHLKAIPEPHWYLTALGVDPDWQRKGIGESLMLPVFASADRDGLPCFLEAPTADNARYYARRGFEVIGEIDIPNSNVHVWQMRRNSDSYGISR